MVVFLQLGLSCVFPKAVIPETLLGPSADVTSRCFQRLTDNLLRARLVGPSEVLKGYVYAQWA